MQYLRCRFSMLLLIGFFFISCFQKKSHQNNIPHAETVVLELDVNDKKDVRLSDLCDSIGCILFELTEGSEMSFINKIIEYDQKYYVRTTHQMQNGRLLVFDLEGNFLYPIGKRGQGPGEYRDIKDFDINEKGEIIISDGIKVIKYDHNGNYMLENRPVPVYELIENSGKVIGLRNHMNDNASNLLIIMNDRLEVINELFSFDKKDFVRVNHYVNYNNLSSNNDTLYFSFPFHDLIYYLSDDSIHSAFFMHFGSKRLPESIFTAGDNYKQISQKIEKIGNFRTRVSFYITDSFIYWRSRDKDYNGYVYFYNRNTKKILAGHGFIDDLCFGLLSFRLKAKNLPINFSEESLLWAVSASFLIDQYNQIGQQEKEQLASKYPHIAGIIKELDEESNPVVFKMKIKNF